MSNYCDDPLEPVFEEGFVEDSGVLGLDRFEGTGGEQATEFPETAGHSSQVPRSLH